MTARPGEEQIAALGDPVASDELEEERAIEPARDLIVDVLDAGWMTQLSHPGARFELHLSAQRQLVFEQQTEPFSPAMTIAVSPSSTMTEMWSRVWPGVATTMTAPSAVNRRERAKGP